MTSVHSSKTLTVHFQGQWRQKIITEDGVICLLRHSTSSIPFRRASYTRTCFNGYTKELLLLGKLKSVTSEQILIPSVSPFWLFAALLSSDTGKGWSALAFCCGLHVKMAEKHKTCCVMALLWPHCIGILSQEPRAKSLCGPFCLINHHIYFHRFIYLFIFFYPSHFIPVRPTFLRHIKQRFFLGFGGSGALKSSLPAVEGWEAEDVGWLNTGSTREKYMSFLTILHTII